MSLLNDSQRAFARAVSKLVYCNPFLPERIESEREALGPEFVATEVVWHAQADEGHESPNATKLKDRVEVLANGLRQRLTRGVRAGAEDLRLYEDLALYFLYNRFEDDFYRAILDRKAVRGALPSTRGISPTFAAISASQTAHSPRRWSRPRSLPFSFRSAGPSISSSGTSLEARCQQPACGQPCGSRSSRATSSAIADPFIAACTTSLPSLSGHQEPARSLWPRRLAWLATFRSIPRSRPSRRISPSPYMPSTCQPSHPP